MLAKRGASAAAQACRRRAALVGNGMMVAFPHLAVADTMPMRIGAREVSSVTARRGGRRPSLPPINSVGFVNSMDVLLPRIAGPSDSLRWISSDAAGKALSRKQTRSAVARVAGGYAATVGLDAEETTAAGIEGLEELDGLVAVIRLLTPVESNLKVTLSKIGQASRLMPGPDGLTRIQGLMKEELQLDITDENDMLRQELNQAHESGALGAMSNGVLTLLISNKGVAEACNDAAADAKKRQGSEDLRRRQIDDQIKQELSPSFNALTMVDQMICSPHRDVLMKVAKEAPPCPPQASCQDLARFITSVMTGTEGLSPVLKAVKVAPQAVCIPGLPKDPARWVVWEGADDRKSVVATLASMIARLMRHHRLGEMNGSVLLGPRGTGKSAMLRVGALAAGVLSRAGQDNDILPIIPVVLDLATIQDAKNAFAQRGQALPGQVPSLQLLADRALQRAGYRTSVENRKTVTEWRSYPWFRSWDDVNSFLEKQGHTMLLVVDEADNYYKVSANLSASLASASHSFERGGILVSGSAAWMRKLLFQPEDYHDELAAVGYLPQRGTETFIKQHTEKLSAMTPLRPMETLAEMVQAAKAVGDMSQDLKDLVGRHEADPGNDEIAAALAEVMVNRGSVMRMLTWNRDADNESRRPLTLAKMVEDTSTGRTFAVASMFVEAVRKRYGQIEREDVGGIMAKAKVGELRSNAAIAVSDIQAILRHRNSERDALEAPKVLNVMADAGMLAFNQPDELWWPSSWAAVAAMLQAVDTRKALTLEQRIHLAHPTIGAATTEPVLVDAFMGLSHDQVQAMDGEGTEELRDMFALLAKAREGRHRFPKTLILPETGLSTGEIYAPAKDEGVDAFVFARQGHVLWVLEAQCKAGGITTKGEMSTLNKFVGIVEGFGRQSKVEEAWPSSERLAQEFEGVTDIRRVHAIITNKRLVGISDEIVKDTVARTWAELDERDVTTTPGVTVSRRWVATPGEAICGSVMLEVQQWAAPTSNPWTVSNWRKANKMSSARDANSQGKVLANL